MVRIGGWVRWLGALRGMVALTLVFAGLAAPARAGGDSIVLTLVNEGAVDGPRSIPLTQDQFDALPQVTLHTSSDWTDGVTEFSGPLAKTVLDLTDLGLTTIVHAVALNDYAVDIPLEDFTQYEVILATHMDGKRLSVRDKGPVWIVYPRDDYPDLHDPVYNSRWIWQLARIELR